MSLLKTRGLVTVHKTVGGCSGAHYRVYLSNGRAMKEPTLTLRKHRKPCRKTPIMDQTFVLAEIEKRREAVEVARSEHIRKCLEAEKVASSDRKSMGVMMTRYLAMKEKYA